MDFSRRAVLERGPIDLLTFLKEQVKLLQRTLPENISINLTYGKDEYTVRADPTRIQQAIVNLATNARDAMPEGGKMQIGLSRVQLDAKDPLLMPDMKAGEWICITVSDNGTGIAEDVLPHIFDPFFTTKEPGKGTGLGLAQVYGIIKQHEGHIDVQTQIGKGTTFLLYLPALAVQPITILSTNKERLIPGAGQLILVVEDDVSTRKAIVNSLELLEYRVLETTNGKEALAIFEQHVEHTDPSDQIALVVSDVIMPEMGGKALFYALKQQAPDIKVLLLTGHPLQEEDMEPLRAQGLSGWLLKPPSLERLAEVIAKILQD
jgi:CheY-like chemotaxis protein